MHPFYFYFLPVKMILTVLSGMTQSLFAHVCHCLFENVCMYARLALLVLQHTGFTKVLYLLVVMA